MRISAIVMVGGHKLYTILVKISNRHPVKLPFISMRPDVTDESNEQTFIDPVADNVSVGPSLGVGLRKRPR